MQYPTGNPTFEVSRKPRNFVGLIGVILAPLIVLGSIFLLILVAVFTQVPDAMGAAIVVFGIWLIAAPVLTLTGAVLCIISLCRSQRPRVGDTIGLCVHMVVLAFLFFGLYAAISYAVSSEKQRIASAQQAGRLQGSFDAATGTYVSSDKTFQLRGDYISTAQVGDQYDGEQKRSSVLIMSKGSPAWSVDAMPVVAAGLPANIWPSVFIDTIEGGMKGGDTIATERRAVLSEVPALRVFSRKSDFEGKPGTSLTDHFCVGGIWYRVGVMATARGSEEDNKKLLEKSLDEFWTSFSIPAGEHSEVAPKPEEHSKISTVRFGDFTINYIHAGKDADGAIKEDDVRKVGDFLTKVGFLKGQNGSLTLEATEDTIVIETQIPDGAGKSPMVEHQLRLWLTSLQQDAFGGRRAIWKTRDSHDSIQATFTAVNALAWVRAGNCDVFYPEGDSELKEEAIKISEWVSNSLMGMYPMQFLLGRADDGGRRITIYASPGAEQVAEYVSNFRVCLQGVRKAVYGDKPLHAAIGIFLFRPVALLDLERPISPQPIPSDWPSAGPWNDASPSKSP